MSAREYCMLLCPQNNAITNKILVFWREIGLLPENAPLIEFPPHIPVLSFFKPNAGFDQFMEVVKNMVSANHALSKVKFEFTADAEGARLDLANNIEAMCNIRSKLIRLIRESSCCATFSNQDEQGFKFSLRLVDKPNVNSHIMQACYDLKEHVQSTDWEVRVYSRSWIPSGKDYLVYKLSGGEGQDRVESSRPLPSDSDYECFEEQDDDTAASLQGQLGDVIVAMPEPNQHRAYNMRGKTWGLFKLDKSSYKASRLPQWITWKLEAPVGTAVIGECANCDPRQLQQCNKSVRKLAMSKLGDGLLSKIKLPSSVSSKTNGHTNEHRRQNASRAGNRVRIFVCRHADRMDVEYGEGWYGPAFRAGNGYQPMDQGMPDSMPERENEMDFHNDCPITKQGQVRAQKLGQRLNQYHFDYCYSSPSLRCVQTAFHLLKGINQVDLEIRVEQGLYEWCGWVSRMPKFLSVDQLSKSYDKISRDYNSIRPLIDHDKTEDETQFKRRLGRLIDVLVDSHIRKATGSLAILIVAHSASLDLIRNRLVGVGFPWFASFTNQPSGHHLTSLIHGEQQLQGNVKAALTVSARPVAGADDQPDDGAETCSRSHPSSKRRQSSRNSGPSNKFSRGTASHSGRASGDATVPYCSLMVVQKKLPSNKTYNRLACLNKWEFVPVLSSSI